MGVGTVAVAEIFVFAAMFRLGNTLMMKYIGIIKWQNFIEIWYHLFNFVSSYNKGIVAANSQDWLYGPAYRWQKGHIILQ